MITGNRINRPQPTPDGWYPKLSPDGRELVFGNEKVYLLSMETQYVHMISDSPATAMGWLDNRFLGIIDSKNGSPRFKLYDTISGDSQYRDDLVAPVFLASANFFQMHDGHWGISEPYALGWDNQWLAANDGPYLSHGVSVNGPWMVTANARGSRYSLMRFYCGALHSEFDTVTPAIFFHINERGDILYGHITQRINYAATGQDEDVTTTPWRLESCGMTLYANDELWLFHPVSNGGRTQVVARRIKDEHDDGVIVIDAAAAVVASHRLNLSAVYARGHFIVAMCDAVGQMAWTYFHPSESREVLKFDVPPVTKNLTVVSFHQFSTRYGDDPNYPSHVVVIDQEGPDAARAVANGKPIVITAAATTSAVSVADNVKALYIGDTGGWKNAEALAKDFKQQWRMLTGRNTPVVWYITPNEPLEPGFQLPPSVDILAPEMYYETAGNLFDQTWRKLGRWADLLGRNNKPWMPVFQAYDRNGRWNREGMLELVSVTPYYLQLLTQSDPRIGQLPPIIGMMFFSVMRPGGVVNYPALKTVHQGLFDAIPGPAEWPAIVSSETSQVPEVTIESYEPRSGKAPLRVRAVAKRLNQHPVTSFVWFYRLGGTNTWILDAANPPNKLDHTFTFSDPDIYEIKLRAVYSRGFVETGAQRTVEVGDSMSKTIPAIGDDEIIQLSEVYRRRRPASAGGEEEALFRDAAYYSWGYVGLRAQGRSHQEALEIFGHTVAENAYYPMPPTEGTSVPSLTDDEIIEVSARFVQEYKTLGVFSRQNFTENMRDQAYYLRNYLVQRQRRNHSAALQLMVADMYRDAGNAVPVEPEPPPLPGGGNTPHVDGRVTTNGRMFRNNAGVWRMCFVSALTILKKNDGAMAHYLDWVANNGFNGIRVFAGALGWANQTPEDARARLPFLLEQCLVRGLYCEVTALTDTGRGYDKREHVRQIADICRRYDNTLLEIANEHWHPTQDSEVHDANYLQRLFVDYGNGLTCALGAPDEDEPPPNDAPWPEPTAHYLTLHLDRGRDRWNQVRRVRELEAASAKVGKPVVNNEPIGADELDGSQTGKQRVNEPAFFFTMGVLNRIFEVGGVHHSQHGLMAELPGPVQQACAAAYVRGFYAVKTRTRVRFKNAGWGDSPIEKADFNVVTRAYSGLAEDGSDNVLVLVGLRHGADPQIVTKNGWSLGPVVEEMAADSGIVRVHKLIR